MIVSLWRRRLSWQWAEMGGYSLKARPPCTHIGMTDSLYFICLLSVYTHPTPACKPPCMQYCAYKCLCWSSQATGWALKVSLKYKKEKYSLPHISIRNQAAKATLSRVNGRKALSTFYPWGRALQWSRPGRSRRRCWPRRRGTASRSSPIRCCQRRERSSTLQRSALSHLQGSQEKDVGTGFCPP